MIAVESKRTEEELRSIRFGKELFLRRTSGKITEEEFNKELAYWMLAEHFEGVKYTPMPMPIGLTKEYFDLAKDERRKVKPEFFENQEVKDFFSMKEVAQEQDKEAIRSLRQLLSVLPEDDEVNRKKVQDKLDNIQRNYIDDMMMYEPMIGGQDVFFVDGLAVT